MTTVEESPVTNRLAGRGLTLAYERRVISTGLDVEIPDGSLTVIIGPNGCGKSTLLRALARVLKPQAGQVILDGKAVSSYPAKEVARKIGLLPQSAVAPDGITVSDLVARGRYPHQGLIRQWTPRDQEAVEKALAATGTTELARRPVDELSGGQRQRAWVAMALAQETPFLLLDEPTSYLDLGYQIELLDLFARLNRGGTTLVAVLHDLNQAARYATHLIVMKTGEVIAVGSPTEIVIEDLVKQVFGLSCLVMEDPLTGTPLVLPRPA